MPVDPLSAIPRELIDHKFSGVNGSSMFGTFTFKHNRLKRDGCSTTVDQRSPASTSTSTSTSTSANQMSKPTSLLPSRSISVPRVQAEAAGPLLRASHTVARRSIKRTAANLTPDLTESLSGFIGTQFRVVGGICTAAGLAYLAYRKLVKPANAEGVGPFVSSNSIQSIGVLH